MLIKFLIRDLWAQVRTKPALALGAEIQKSPPYFLNLEPTNFCNLNCPICSFDGSRKKGYMSRETAEIALDQAQELGVTEIRFFLAGEPFFHPHLAQLVASAKKRNFITLIHTNGTYMPSERIQRVLDAGLDKISFSFDGENPTDYEQIRVGAKFEHTLNNILRFLQIKKLRGGKFPLTTIQVIKYYHTPNSDKITSEFKQHFANLPVDEFLLLHPFVWPDQKAQDFNRPSGSKYYPCMIPWTSLSLGWDGRVFWCCGDLNGKGFLGNIRQTTLKEIWNGELIHTIRHGLVKRELKNLQLCQNCEALYHRYNPIFADFRDYWRQIKRTL